MKSKAIATLILCAGLSGCGVTYFSPDVSEENTTLDVTVVAMTSDTIRSANRTPYTPRALPAAFYQTAGAGGTAQGLGALPEAPPAPAVQPPLRLELRRPPPVTPKPYRIGVGDVITLATRAPDSLRGEATSLPSAQSQRQPYTVRDDGAIAIPEVGAVNVVDLTVEEAEDRVFERLVQNQIDPEFSLEISGFNSKRVTIGGAVAQSTAVPIQLNALRISDALAAAGGIALKDREYASIRIYRDGALYQIPLTAYFDQPELQSLRLADGDAIYIDNAYDLERAQAFYEQQIAELDLRQRARKNALDQLQAEVTLRRAELDERRGSFEQRLELGAVARDYVYLTGETEQQARVALPFGRQASLADIFYENGGFPTATGNPREIYVLRAGKGDSVTAFHLDVQNIVNLTLSTRLQMRPNDIIFVSEQPITRWNRALSQILPGLVATTANGLTN